MTRSSPAFAVLVGVALAVLLLHQGADAKRSCMKGANGCKKCKGSKCVQCYSGWGLHSKGYCNRCTDVNCAVCSGNRPSSCGRCNEPWYAQGGKCLQGACTPKSDGCQQCSKGKCKKCQRPQWDTNAWEWTGVYGKSSAGTCVQCTPEGDHKQWCQACSGDKPSVCTSCGDPINKPVMYLTPEGHCEFCTQSLGDCTQCYWDDSRGGPRCVSCKQGWNLVDGACTQ